MSTQKIYTNAAISYFFLGPLFLLAKNNPDFSETFVRNHAKVATKIYGLLAVYLLLHFVFLSKILNFYIPVLPLRLDKAVLMIVFASVFTILIARAVRAFSGREATNVFESKQEDTLNLNE